MTLTRVTITGADDSVDPNDLVPLTREFPWVEWGILVSASNLGRPRFPSAGWIERFLALDLHARALHVCGQFTRELLAGDLLDDTLARWLAAFDRIQLNFHGEPSRLNVDRFARLAARLAKPMIFQHDGRNDGLTSRAILAGADAYALFDVSGGAGILPTAWPPPAIPGRPQGYAGGLGPDSLEAQLPRIATAAGDLAFWIDMETRVRSSDDSIFEIAKVRRCLEIAASFVVTR